MDFQTIFVLVKILSAFLTKIFLRSYSAKLHFEAQIYPLMSCVN